MSPKTLETTISQDIIYISSNIHGTNTNFETYKSRFKKVNQKVHEMFDKLKNPNSNYSLNTTELDFVSRELIYMKDKKQENRFKNAIETQEDLGQIVSATETTLKESVCLYSVSYGNCFKIKKSHLKVALLILCTITPATNWILIFSNKIKDLKFKFIDFNLEPLIVIRSSR